MAWGGSGGWTGRVDLISPGVGVIASTANQDFTVAAASYSESAADAVRSQAKLSVRLPRGPGGEPHRLLPRRVGDLLDARTGTLLSLWTGPAAGPLVQLGVLELDQVQVQATAVGEQLELSCLGQEIRARQAGFWQVWSAPAGATVVSVVHSLMHPSCVGGCAAVLEAVGGALTVAVSYQPGEDRLKHAVDLATSVGAESFFDRSGTLVVRRAPAYGDSPTARWTLAEGQNATIRELTRSTSDADLRNGVAVIGNANDSDGPVVATAWHTDRSSPIFYDPADPGSSRVGPHPEIVTLDDVRTQGEADAAARRLLLQHLGQSESVAVNCPPNPEITAGDTVWIEASAGVSGLYAVASVTHDLFGGSTQLSCVSYGRN